MNSQDNARFAKTLAVLSETYKPFSPAKENIWAAVFKDHEIQDFESAVLKHITDPVRGSYPDVKPADILRFMPEPKPAFQIENKGSVEGCENAQRLRAKYLPLYKKLKVEK